MAGIAMPARELRAGRSSDRGNEATEVNASLRRARREVVSQVGFGYAARAACGVPGGSIDMTGPSSAPRRGEAGLEPARELFAQHQWAESLSLFEQALESAPASTAAEAAERVTLLVEAARAEWGAQPPAMREGAARKYNEALHLSRAFGLPLDEARVLRHLGDVECSRDHLQDARRHFEELIDRLDQLEPDGREMQSALRRHTMLLALELRVPEEAIASAERWLRLFETVPSHRVNQMVYFWAAWVFGAVGRLEEARALALKALELSPPGRRAHGDLQRLLLALDTKNLDIIRRWGWDNHRDDYLAK